MTRRGGAPWAPTSLPALRRQWFDVLEEGLEQTQRQGEAPAEVLAQAERDVGGLRSSRLYRMARDMTDLAVGAAASLPEWSPAAAIPAEFGLLCWAKPVGRFDWPVPGSDQRIEMPIDAFLWGVTGSGVAVSAAVRSDRIAAQLNPGLARLPLLSHPMGLWALEEPVAHRLEGGAVSPLSVLGCAWLLMGQPSVSTVRVIGGGAAGSGDSAGGGADPEAVSIIELRRLPGGDRDGAGASGRKITKRFLVSGHWRNQRCGPGGSMRKPLWINGYLKGDPNAPLMDASDRVYVWRR